MASDELLSQAMSLPAEERADLAARLMESLEEPEDADVEQAWKDEIRTRIDQLRNREVQPVPWEEARRRIFGTDDGGNREA